MGLFSCGLKHGQIFTLIKRVGLYNDEAYTHENLYVAFYIMDKA